MVCLLCLVVFTLIPPLSLDFCTYDHVYFSLFLIEVYITFYVTLFCNRNYLVHLLFLDHTLLSLYSLFPSQAASYVFLFLHKKEI
jgi:hypothetical protein